MNINRSKAPQVQSSNGKRRLVGLPAVAFVTLLIGAAGGCASEATTAAPTVVVTQTVTATPAAPTVTETIEATPPATSPEAAPAKAEPAKAAEKVTVPDGVGLNYQDAQDAWRAAGLHVSPAEDATGANRIPVLDANWVVLSQDLEAGSTVDADSFITATVKKYTDD